jgi:hypothetical protein
MQIDQTRQHTAASGVDHPTCRPGNGLLDRHDPVARHRKVGESVGITGVVDDTSVPDHEVVQRAVPIGATAP